MTFINVRKIHAAFTTFSICLLPIYAYAATDVVSELEQKLMNAKSSVESASGLSGFTLQSVKFNGSFAATPLQLKDVTTKATPFSATSQAICACTPGTYSLVSGSMGQVETGESFSSAESLSTDTTVTVEGNYGAVTAKATAEIKTNQEKTSSKETNNLSQANVGSSSKVELTCDKYNQPQCFIGSGTTDQITYVDTQTQSPDINYEYDVFPVNNGSTDFNAATFSATLLKAGSTTAGDGVIVFLYKNGQQICALPPTGPQPSGGAQYWSANAACFNKDSSYAYKNATQYLISVGGNPNGTIGIRFQNKKAWTGEIQSYNQVLDIPNGFQGSDMLSISVRNNYYITTGDVTQTREIKIVSAIPLDTAKHKVTGTYNANDMASLAMNVNYSQYSWSKLHKTPNQYTDSINACGNNLVEAKRTWKAACSSPAKKVLMFKKYIKENGPINLPGGGKIIGGHGQGGRNRK